jgi:hypothetical protein
MDDQKHKRPAKMGSVDDNRPFNDMFMASAWVLDKYPRQDMIAELYFDAANLLVDEEYKSDFLYGIDRYGRFIHRMYFGEDI